MDIALGTQLGRYEIRSKIGAGGMGEVYLAEDSQLHRRVALKILPAEVAFNQDRMRRFNQEARARPRLIIRTSRTPTRLARLTEAFEPLARCGTLVTKSWLNFKVRGTSHRDSRAWRWRADKLVLSQRRSNLFAARLIRLHIPRD